MRPETADDVIDAIFDATRAGEPLEIRGGGSKAEIGAPREAALLDMSGFDSVIDYDPPELVLTAGAGTPLSVIEALVESEGQQLAFEPFDHGPLFGQRVGRATIGGVVAAGVAGSRRLTAGGARDHLLGFEAVSGRGERFVAGAKVVKNVTGYDLPKLAANSWGRLFAMTEVTLKVLPRGRERTTLALDGLTPRAAQAALAKVLAAPADIQAAVVLPGARSSLTAVRLEGFGPSVAARAEMVRSLWSDLGAALVLSPDDADALWNDLKTLAPLDDGRPLWRINTPPSGGPAVVEALAPLGARWLFDWGGGLTWLTFDGDPAVVRAAAETAGGHAMLVRADAAMRAAVPALHPLPEGVAKLEARIRRAFDPSGVFETGRFHAD
jgi:glycolate oxidase FAD binding subunit